MDTTYDNPFNRVSTNSSDFARYSSDVLNRPIEPYKPSTPSTARTPEDEQKYTNDARRREAVKKATEHLNSIGSNSSGSDSQTTTSGGTSQAVSSDGSAFRSYPMVIQQPQGQKSGLGAAIGTAAGLGLSIAFPGLGSAVTAALPGFGGQIGGLFG